MPGSLSVKSSQLKKNIKNKNKKCKKHAQVPFDLQKKSMCKVQILRREREEQMAAGKESREVIRDLHVFTEVTVNYLCCMPEQFHITCLSNSKTRSRTLHLSGLIKSPKCVYAFPPGTQDKPKKLQEDWAS